MATNKKAAVTKVAAKKTTVKAAAKAVPTKTETVVVTKAIPARTTNMAAGLKKVQEKLKVAATVATDPKAKAAVKKVTANVGAAIKRLDEAAAVSLDKAKTKPAAKPTKVDAKVVATAPAPVARVKAKVAEIAAAPVAQQPVKQVKPTALVAPAPKVHHGGGKTHHNKHHHKGNRPKGQQGQRHAAPAPTSASEIWGRTVGRTEAPAPALVVRDRHAEMKALLSKPPVNLPSKPTDSFFDTKIPVKATFPPAAAKKQVESGGKMSPADMIALTKAGNRPATFDVSSLPFKK